MEAREYFFRLSYQQYQKGNTEEEFYNILEKNMLPVYESARRQGYEIWEY